MPLHADTYACVHAYSHTLHTVNVPCVDVQGYGDCTTRVAEAHGLHGSSLAGTDCIVLCSQTIVHWYVSMYARACQSSVLTCECDRVNTQLHALASVLTEHRVLCPNCARRWASCDGFLAYVCTPGDVHVTDMHVYGACMPAQFRPRVCVGRGDNSCSIWSGESTWVWVLRVCRTYYMRE